MQLYSNPTALPGNDSHPRILMLSKVSSNLDFQAPPYSLLSLPVVFSHGLQPINMAACLLPANDRE